MSLIRKPSAPERASRVLRVAGSGVAGGRQVRDAGRAASGPLGKVAGLVGGAIALSVMTSGALGASSVGATISA